MPVNWSRLTVNLDPETAKAAKAIARKQKRSFASYVATLIEKDLEENTGVSEPAGEYKVAPPPKPPDKSKLSPGAGPRHRVSA